jgi:hypothetical protein
VTAEFIQNEMAYEEFLKWILFFKERPLGWREDQRTYMLLRAQGAKGKPEDFFPTLRMLKQKEVERQIPDQAKPKGKLLEMMQAANSKSKDKLEIF